MSYMQNPGRRHSLLEVSQTSKWRPRSVSTSVADVANNSNASGGVTRRSSATPCTTPCFVNPSMAFTTQFSYDSPIQILTSSSSGVLNPRAMSKYKRRCSLRNLPHCCKMVLILLFFAIASGLFIYRTINERQNVPVLGVSHDCQDDDDNPDCQDLDDELVHDHPSLKRFMRSVKQPPHFHVLTSDLDDPEVRADDEQQLLSQLFQSEEIEAGHIQEGTPQELPTEELLEELEPLHNHWMPEHTEQSHKMQRLTIQGQYTEDLQHDNAVQTLQQDTIQNSGPQSHNYLQGEYNPVQPYNTQGEPSPQMQQYNIEINYPVGQYNMQDHGSVQQNIKEQTATEQQYSRENSNQPIMQENWPEVRAIQGELMNLVPQQNYAGYGNREQQILQNLEHNEQQHILGQEWVAPGQGKRQAGEVLHRQESVNPQHQGGPRVHHHHQPRPAQLQQRRNSGEPGEARLRRPQDKTPQQNSRKLRQGPLKPKPRDAGKREQKPGRAEDRGGSRGYGQRLPPGVNPNRYRLSEL